jgi:hypothetical protein
MTQDHGTGRPWSQGSYCGFGDGRDAEQEHFRKLAARQRERAARMRAEAVELRARNRLLRPAWPPAGNSGSQHITEAVGGEPRSSGGSSD